MNFVFVVPYFNTGVDIERTIFSMLSQSNDAWRVVLINDVSDDKTPERVHELVTSLPKTYRDKFTLIDNTVKHGEVRNTLEAVKNIADRDIVCRLDGGDWLTENDLLYAVANAYSDERVAVAWTAHRWGYTSQNISGPMMLKGSQTVYQHPWVSSHMKTFRCEQLKKVPEQNFKDADGNYIMIACDQAIFLPTMHLSILEGKTLTFVPVIGYHYNIDLSKKDLFTCDRSIRQKQSAEMLRERGYLT